jgi:hypothetical protein
MRKILALAIVVTMLFALAVPAAALSITVPNASPVIDGTRDSVYVGPFPIATAVGGDGEPQEASATGQVWLAWDASALYVYVEVSDTTPNDMGDTEHYRDSAEFFVDWLNAKGNGMGAPVFPDGSGIDGIGTDDGFPYQQIRLSSTLTGENYGISGANWFDEGWGGVVWGNEDGAFDNFEWVIFPLNGDISTGYGFEIKAYAPEGVTLNEGMIIPFDFQINDNMHGEGRTGMVWMTQNPGNGHQWGTPHGCGVTLTLGGAPAGGDEHVCDDDCDHDAAGGGEEADATTPLPRPTPRTGDAGVMALIALMAIAAAGIVVFRRKAVK